MSTYVKHEPVITPGFYRHFKGKEYVVLGEMFDAESGSFSRVCYYPKTGSTAGIFERSIENFTEHVERPDYGYSGPRFWRIDG